METPMGHEPMLIKQCSKCGETKPIGEFHRNRSRWDRLHPQCKMCAKERGSAYRTANPERMKERYAAWRAANPERVKAYHAANRERRNEYSAAWRAANPDYVKAYHKTEAGRVTRARAAAKRRGLLATCDATLTAQEWAGIILAYEGRCAYCKVKLREGGLKKGNKLTMDHVIPLARGGTHTASNTVPSCAQCNSRKGAKMPGAIGIALHVPLEMGI